MSTPTSDLRLRAFSRRAALAGMVLSPVAFAQGAGPRVSFFATASGKETLDGDEGGGNPFATALIEAMGRRDLDLAGAARALQSRTADLSHGFMQAETKGLESAPPWRFGGPAGERRVALAVIFSDYGASDSAPSLPGAATDGQRVAAAFRDAGFSTRLVANATHAGLKAALRDFSRQSAHADVGALYCTGHGVEHEGVQYVLFGDHVVADGVAGLARAARWTDIAAAPRARTLNLAFWAGCRNDPFA